MGIYNFIIISSIFSSSTRCR